MNMDTLIQPLLGMTPAQRDALIQLIIQAEARAPRAANAAATKVPDKNSVALGETVTFTIVLDNSTPGQINNITLTDYLDSYFTLVPGSVKVNGTAVPDSAISGSYDLGNLAAGGTLTVTLQATVNAGQDYYDNALYNSAEFRFTPTAGGSNYAYANSRVKLDLGDYLKKSVDKVFAQPGDIVTYTIEYTNPFPYTLQNVHFEQDSTLFYVMGYKIIEIPGTLTLNGTPIVGTMTGGFYLPNDIAPGETITLQYKAQIPPDAGNGSIFANLDRMQYLYTDSNGADHYGYLTTDFAVTMVTNVPVGQPGPQGPAGPQGPQGPAGPGCATGGGTTMPKPPVCYPCRPRYCGPTIGWFKSGC